MTTWTRELRNPITYLLLEDSSYILLEDSSKIILDQSGRDSTTWTNETIS